MLNDIRGVMSLLCKTTHRPLLILYESFDIHTHTHSAWLSNEETTSVAMVNKYTSFTRVYDIQCSIKY